MDLLFNFIEQSHLLLGVSALACLLSLTLWIGINRIKRLPLPPGPKPWPIVGNISDFPTTHEGRFWAKHKDLYGNRDHSIIFYHSSSDCIIQGPSAVLRH